MRRPFLYVDIYSRLKTRKWFWEILDSLISALLKEIGSNSLEPLVQSIHFVTQRALYESRECPLKTYFWQVFTLFNIFVEIPWNSPMALLVFLVWYYLI